MEFLRSDSLKYECLHYSLLLTSLEPAFECQLSHSFLESMFLSSTCGAEMFLEPPHSLALVHFISY